MTTDNSEAENKTISHAAQRKNYVDLILDSRNEEDVHAIYTRVYRDSHEQLNDETDMDFIKRCAEQDFEDAEQGAAVFQDIADELLGLRVTPSF